MYTITAYLTGASGDVSIHTLYNPLLTLDGRVILSGSVDLELGKAGSATITIPRYYGKDESGADLEHPLYSGIQKMKTIIQVMDGNDEIFYGRVLREEKGIDGRKKFFLEGALTFLIDRVMSPPPASNGYKYDSNLVIGGVTQGNAETFFGHCINTYNDQTVGVEPLKIFRLANDAHTENFVHVSPSYGQTSLEFEEHEYETVQDALYGKLIDVCGGYLKARYIGRDANMLPMHTIDLVAEDDINDAEPGAFHNCPQAIRMGKNLLDITENVSGEELATVVVPLGKMMTEERTDEEGHKTTEDTERVNIAGYDMNTDPPTPYNTANPGELYVADTEAQQIYGNIWQTVVWDEVENPAELYRKALEYLDGRKNIIKSLTVNAIDLSILDVDVAKIHTGDFVRVISPSHGYNGSVWLRCVKIHLDLLNPAGCKYTFESIPKTLSGRQSATESNVKSVTASINSGGGISDENYTSLEQRVLALERNTAIMEPPAGIATISALFNVIPDWQERRYYLGAASGITDRPGAGTADESYGIIDIRKLPQGYGSLTYYADNGILWYTTANTGVLQPWQKTAFDT